MASIKAKRGAIRGAFTRSWKELVTESNKPEKDLNEIRRLKKQLEDRFSSLEKVDEEYDRYMLEKESTEEEYTDEYNSTIEYRDKYSDISLIVNNLERIDSGQNNYDNVSNASSYHTDVHLGSKYKLPKLELRKFNGDPKEWLGWWSQFSGIHEDVTLSMEHKFQYLIQATVEKSSAYELVTSFPPTATNYPKAIKYLTSRFGNENILVEVYVRELLILVLNNTINNEGKTVASLYDKLETQLRGSESLGVTRDKYAAMLYPLVESALTEEVLKAWQRIRSQKMINQADNLEGDQLNSLMQFLRAEVDSEIHLKLARAGVSSNEYYSTNDSILQTIERTNSCFFCKKSGHTKQSCRHYKQWVSKQASKDGTSSKDSGVNDTPRNDADKVKNLVETAKYVEERKSDEEDESAVDYAF